MSFPLFEIVSDQDVWSERFDRVEVKLKRSLTLVDAQAHADAILDALAELPSRDRFALTVEISGDERMIGELDKRNEVIQHIAEFHEDGSAIEFRIEILKEVVEQRLSIYSPTALGAYLESSPLSDTLVALSKRFRDRLVFECYSESPGKGSETLSFVKGGGSHRGYSCAIDLAPTRLGTASGQRVSHGKHWHLCATGFCRQRTHRRGRVGRLHGTRQCRLVRDVLI